MLVQRALHVFLLFIALMPTIICGHAKQDEEPPTEITGESYWYNLGMERVLSSSETKNYIEGVIQARHTVSRFRVRKTQVADPASKSRGLKMVVEEMLAWLNTTSKDFAKAKLNALTGEQFANAPDWEKWYRDNDPYLVWSDRRNHLIVDDEAKRARIPTEQFRKNHPWAENP